jgi:transcriptional regulator with XRE-family HTH domain
MACSPRACPPKAEVRGSNPFGRANNINNYPEIDHTYLSGVERSQRNVSIDNIARIAKGLKIEPWRLLKGD